MILFFCDNNVTIILLVSDNLAADNFFPENVISDNLDCESLALSPLTLVSIPICFALF